ncbi:MAG: hypothetical protein RLZZ570_651 [Bacteroidota bacterium]|jgi:hypothetical protein
MRGLILLLGLMCFSREVRAQLNLSQQYSTGFGQTALALPKGAKLHQNLWILGNHLEYGITNTTSIGLGVMPLYFKQTGIQFFSAINLGQTFKFNEREFLKLSAIGGFSYSPRFPGLNDYGGLMASYSRKFSSYDLSTISYGYFVSSIYYPPFAHQVSINFKHAFKNTRIGVEVSAGFGWSNSNWGLPEWGTIWHIYHARPALIITKKFGENNSLFFGALGINHSAYTPIDGLREWVILRPEFGGAHYF